MKRFFLVLLLATYTTAGIAEKEELKSPINVSKYAGYLGYFLKALVYAKHLHPSLTVANIKELELGYTLLRGGSSALSAVSDSTSDIVKNPLEKVSDIGLVAVKAGSAVVGYSFPDSEVARILSGASLAATYFPTVLSYFTSSLPELKASFNLDEFQSPKAQTTYLACSYNDPVASAKNFKIWAEERLIQTDAELVSRLTFAKNTVLISGRWILTDGGKSYVFGTLADPLLLQATCLTAVANYARENGIEITDQARVQMSSGNNSFNNSYPVRFFNPTIMKAPNWSKQKPLLLRKALLLMEKKQIAD